MRYEVILLDADDTLFDFGKAEYTALKILLETHNLPCDDKYLDSFHLINQSVWHDFEKGLLPQDLINKTRFKRYHDVCFSQYAVNPHDLATEYLTILAQQRFLIDGAQDFIESLVDSCNLYILTNGFASVQTHRIKGSVLAPYISDIFISEVIGYNKPDKRIFQYVLEQLNITNVSKVLMIGDSLTSDVIGANRAQIDVCWYNPHQKRNHTDAIPTYTVSNFDEILSIIQNESFKS